eukprot:3605920-Amphidinium_carterae.2
MAMHRCMPWVFAGLLEEKSEALMLALSSHYELWQEAKEMQGVYWRKVQRSWLSSRPDSGSQQGRGYKGFCKRVGSERLYDSLVCSNVVAGLHRFTLFDYEQKVVGRGLASRSCKQCKSSFAGSYREVVTRKTVPDYHSPAPLMATAPYEDLCVWKWCKEECNNLEMAENAWLTVVSATCAKRGHAKT